MHGVYGHQRGHLPHFRAHRKEHWLVVGGTGVEIAWCICGTDAAFISRPVLV